MPWNNQSGGGGGPWGGGGNSGGPWGQGPRGPSGPQGSPPDLEDIIRRGQDRLRRVLPGGGRNKPGLRRPGRACAAGVLGVPVRLHRAARRGGGRAHGSASRRTSSPSPACISIGGRSRRSRSPTPPKSWSTSAAAPAIPAIPGLMLSGDQNIVDVQFSVAYQVSDPKAYLFNVADPDDMVRQVAESAMREVVGRSPAQDIFRDDRQGIAESVRSIIQGSLDSYGTGPFGERALDRGRGAAARSGRRVRRSAARRAGRRPLRRGSQPVFQPEARRRRAARPRRSAKKRPPTRTASRRKRRARPSASCRSTTNTPRRPT